MLKIKKRNLFFLSFSLVIGIFCFNLKKIMPLYIEYLYHGSPVGHCDTLYPSEQGYVGLERRRDMLSASPSKAFASCHLVDWDRSWADQFAMTAEIFPPFFTVYMVIGDLERYRTFDRGGSLYQLKSEDFQLNQLRDLGVFQWLTTKSSEVLHEEHFASALDAMKTYGVKVFALSKEQFSEYQKTRDNEKVYYLKKYGQALS